MSNVQEMFANRMQEYSNAYGSYLEKLKIERQIGVYAKAYTKFLTKIGRDKTVSVQRELYRKYKLQYAENNNYELPDIKVVNMVISTFVNHIDVEALKKDNNTEYYPKKFPGFVTRYQNPRSTMLIFKTGKVICTGIKEKISATKALAIFSKRFNIKQKINIDIQNLVVSVDFSYNVELEEVANKIPRAIYEPEQFPGIIYRNEVPKAVFLIFTSGKSICVGTKDIADAFQAVFYLRKKLIEYDLLIPKDEGEDDDDDEDEDDGFEEGEVDEFGSGSENEE